MNASIVPQPNLRYRSSGVPQLGDVAAHWEAQRLKGAGGRGAGSAFPLELQGFPNQEPPFFKVGDRHKTKEGQYHSSESTISRRDAVILYASVLPVAAIIYAKIW